jgi:hypothetical protein
VDQLGLFGFLGQKQYGKLKQLEVRLGESTWFYCLWTRQNLPSLDQISGKNFSAIFLTILTFLYAAFILRSFPMVALEKDGVLQIFHFYKPIRNVNCAQKSHMSFHGSIITYQELTCFT